MVNHSSYVNAMSRSFRTKRFEHFLKTMQVGENDRILDVGGSPGFWLNSGFEANVTILNIHLPQSCPQPFTWIEGDACDMSMFANQSFDIIFSNSVIEHVGDITRQQQMANEIMRISKRYWIQTPYKHFPVEPHFIFPFFQYLPTSLRMIVAGWWPFSFAKRQGRNPKEDAATIWLLDIKQLKGLFPNATLECEKFLGLTKSMLIYTTQN